MYRFLFSTLLLICTLSSGAQSDCGNATPINALPYTSPGNFFGGHHSTCGANDNYTSLHRCANTYMNGEEFVYSFTPTAQNACININLTPRGLLNNIPPYLFVTKACPDDPNGECIAQEMNPDGGAINITDLNLEAGETYYILVSSTADCYDYTLNITASGNCNPNPPGSNCSTAETINTLPYATNESTCNHTTYLRDGNQCASAFYNEAPQYFYKYTATSNICIEMIGETTDLTMRLSVHDTCPTFHDSTCVNSYFFYTFGERTYYETLDSGKTYYFVISSGSSGAACSGFDIVFNEISDEGSTCAKAYTIDSSSFSLPFQTTQCKGDFYEEESCAPFNDGGNEVLYKYESDGDECILASLLGMSNYGSLNIYNGCPLNDNSNLLQTVERCAFNDPSDLFLEYTINDPGTYYFVVSGRKRTFFNGNITYTDFSYDFQFSSSTLDPTGSTCQTADVLDASIPSIKNDLSIQCKGDDYGPQDACNNLIRGSDYVLTYTAPSDFCGSIFAKNTMGNGGISLFSACPDDPNRECLGSTACPTRACDSIYLDHSFEAGKTYYIVASGNGGNFFEFDLEIRKSFNTTDGCAPCQGAACDECVNANFETSTLSNWVGGNGTYNNPGQNNGFLEGYINDMTSGHTIMNAGLDDPLVGDLVKTSGPLGGKYSLRLGNYISGGRGEQISFDINVNQFTKNFFYYFAVVFEDPAGHTEVDQPFFGVEMVDANGDVIDCASYEVRSSTAEGFTEVATQPNDRNINAVKYRDWSLVAVPLDNYIGQTVTITFTATDCGLSGHMGYAYIDAFCGDLGIEASGGGVICPNEPINLTAPDGFEMYTWSTGETTKSITVNIAGTYTVDLTPFSNPGQSTDDCIVTLEYEVIEAPSPVAEFDFDLGCNDAFVEFYCQPNEGDSIRWDFDDGTFSSEDTVNHGFPGPGTYNVRLIVINNSGCKDSIENSVTIDPYTVLDPLNTPDTLEACLLDDVLFTSDELNNVSYFWTGPQGYTNTAREFSFTPTDINQSGYYYLTAISNEDTCVSTIDSTFLYLESIPEIGIKPDTTICFKDSLQDMYAFGGLSYSWLPNSTYSNPDSSVSQRFFSQSDSAYVLLGFNLCPDTMLGTYVTVNSATEFLNNISDTSICEGQDLGLSSFSNPIEYHQWISPNADSIFTNPLEIENIQPSDAGLYTLIAYLGDGLYCPFDSTEVLIDVLEKPILNPLANPDPTCPGEPTTLSVSGASTYRWFDENDVLISTQASFDSVFSQSQNLRIEAQDANGCVNDATVMVNLSPAFTVDLGLDKQRCLGDDAVFEVNLDDFYALPSQILWNTGATSPSITVSSAGTYSVEVTINGCVERDTVALKIQDPANFSLGNDTILCENQSLTIDLSSFSGNINWSDGDDSPIKVITSPGGLFEVEISSGACLLSDDIQVDFQSIHQLNPEPDTSICEGDTIRYFPPNNGTSIFYINAIEQSDNTVEINDVGSYTVLLENTIGQCTATDSWEVNVEQQPTGTLPDSVFFCEGKTVSVDATVNNARDYLWEDGSIKPLRVFNQQMRASVQYQLGACTVFDTVEVLEISLPQPMLGPDTSHCDTTPLVLINPQNGNYDVNWYANTINNPVSTNPTSYICTTSGMYILEYRTGTCFTRDTLMVRLDNMPSVDLGPDTLLCPSESIVLDATSSIGSTYQWSTGSQSSSITATNPGEYSVVVQNGVCSAFDTINIQYQTVQNPDLGPDLSICEDQSVVLDPKVSNYDSIIWSTGSQASNITVNTSNTYAVDVYYAHCVVSDLMDLQVDNIPVFNLGNDTSLCPQQSLNLSTPFPNLPHVWQDGTTNSTYQVNQEGTYFVDVQNGQCSYRDKIVVDYIEVNIPDLGPDTSICEDQQLRLSPNVQGFQNIIWNTGSTNDYIDVDQTGVYACQVFFAQCEVRDTLILTILEYPDLELGPDILACQGDEINLETGLNFSHLWNTGSTNPSIIVRNSGLYHVIVSNAQCISEDSIEVDFQSPPALDLGPDTSVCANIPYMVNSGLPQLNHKWSHGPVNHEISFTQPGIYALTVTDGPCVVVDSLQLTHYPLPQIPDSVFKICPKDSLSIDFNAYAAEAQWSDGLRSLERNLKAPSSFDLTLTSIFGCKSDVFIQALLDYTCPEYVYVPSAFTPNNDGVNDRFKPVLHDAQFIELFIFNRWGEEVFKTYDIKSTWDGTYLNEEAQSGQYVWTMRVITPYDEEKEFTGKVLLIR